MQEIFLSSQLFSFINLYSSLKEFDDFSLIKLCKTAVDNQVGSISVEEKYVENVWKWLELSDVKLSAVINNFSDNLSVDLLFKKIKNVVSKGADIVEVFLSPLFFDIDFNNTPTSVDEYLLAMVEAKGVKKLKVSIESAFLKYPSKFKEVVSFLSKYDIDFIKTSSGLYSSASTINHLNAILEEALSTDIGIDFLYDRNSTGKFIVDDAYRLSSLLLGQEVVRKGRFFISCFLSDFLLSLGKSTC